MIDDDPPPPCPSSTLCPPNPIYKDVLPSLQRPAFLLKAPDTDDRWWINDTFHSEHSQLVVCLPDLFPVSSSLLFPSLKHFSTSAGQGSHSVHIGSSSVQFKGEVWELSLQQRTHNWHPSCLIKGESTGMDPLSQILAFITILCKQSHTHRDS